MNRKQARMAAKMPPNQLKALYTQTGLQATEQAAKAYAIATAYVLHDKLNFGKTKLQQTVKQIDNMFDSILNGYLALEDMQAVLLEEADIKFDFGGK